MPIKLDIECYEFNEPPAADSLNLGDYSSREVWMTHRVYARVYNEIHMPAWKELERGLIGIPTGTIAVDFGDN